MIEGWVCYTDGSYPFWVTGQSHPPPPSPRGPLGGHSGVPVGELSVARQAISIGLHRVWALVRPIDTCATATNVPRKVR